MTDEGRFAWVQQRSEDRDLFVKQILQDENETSLERQKQGSEMEERDFGWALKLLREGKKLQRAGWNGKGMWIALVPADNWGASQVAKDSPFQNIATLPWIGIKTADDKFVPWPASQTDVLATDWSVVP